MKEENGKQKGFLRKLFRGTAAGDFWGRKALSCMVGGAAGLLMILLLAGCAQSEGQEGRQAEKTESFTADTNTVILTRENGLIGYICEEFDESLYHFADLEEMLSAEVEDYNAQMGGGGIEIKECALADGVVRISLSYAEAEDYEKFNGMQLLYGETPEEGARRFSLPANLPLIDAHDPERTIALSELDKERDYRILITDDDSNIRIHGSDIFYIGEGDMLVGDGEVATSAEASLHVIIY